ncbi:MAG: DUF167 domain-containing protein [Candidatus Odinarchaeota archaeon]
MIHPHDKGTLLVIRVKPRSKRQAIRLDKETICQVHVKAPPIHGRANAEVQNLVAKHLEISPTKVKILSGKKAANKTLLIEGMDPEAVRSALTR